MLAGGPGPPPSYFASSVPDTVTSTLRSVAGEVTMWASPAREWGPLRATRYGMRSGEWQTFSSHSASTCLRVPRHPTATCQTSASRPPVPRPAHHSHPPLLQAAAGDACFTGAAAGCCRGVGAAGAGPWGGARPGGGTGHSAGVPGAHRGAHAVHTLPRSAWHGLPHLPAPTATASCTHSGCGSRASRGGNRGCAVLLGSMQQPGSSRVLGGGAGSRFI